jgi:ferric iron reductase protein FhuF
MSKSVKNRDWLNYSPAEQDLEALQTMTGELHSLITQALNAHHNKDLLGTRNMLAKASLWAYWVAHRVSMTGVDAFHTQEEEVTKLGGR